MPAGVVVVKRARRRSFALFWAVLAWARSLVASLRGPGAAPLLPVASPVGHVRFPALVAQGVGADRCTACGDCVRLCPSGCLAVTAAASPSTGPARFTLDPGACIGCGRCIEGCPEAALQDRAAPTILVTGARGVAGLDLLDEAASR